MSAFDWTPERIEELMSLHLNGKSASEIGAHFGITRNAAIGKIHREKIKRGIITEKPRLNRVRNPYRKKAMNVPIVISDPTPLALVPDHSRLASIIDATGCKWPVRDDASFVGGIACCNHATKDGSSYCPYHARVNRASYSRTLISETIKSALYIHKKAAA